MATSLIWKEASEIIAALIDNEPGDSINLAELLEKNGYKTALDGVKLDCNSWRKLKILDLSNLSLRSADITNLPASNIIFRGSDLSYCYISSKNKIEFIDFNLAELGHALVDLPIYGEINFQGAIFNETIIIASPNLRKDMTNLQLSDSIYLEVQPEDRFNQLDLVKRYNVTNKKGICNGLVIDFAMYLIDGSHDYINRLNLLLSQPNGKLMNFIISCQQHLQTFEICAANETSYKVDEDHSFIEIPNGIFEPQVIGITFKNPLGSHIISVARVGGGYIIFDPNLGVIKCVKQSAEENLAKLKEQLNNIHLYYKQKLFYCSNISVADLANIVRSIKVDQNGKRYIEKYSMSNLYFGTSMFCCFIFLSSLYMLRYLNDIVGMTISIISSLAISSYLAKTLTSYYQKYLCKISRQIL